MERRSFIRRALASICRALAVGRAAGERRVVAPEDYKGWRSKPGTKGSVEWYVFGGVDCIKVVNCTIEGGVVTVPAHTIPLGHGIQFEDLKIKGKQAGMFADSGVKLALSNTVEG